MSGAERVSVLHEIVRHKRDEVAAAKASVPEAELLDRIAAMDPPRGFVAAIRRAIGDGRAAVIAECKRASPSKGVIRAAYDPAAIASSYAEAGATCLSVLTDAKYFGGSAAHLAAARRAATLPVLRKDFIVDAYQIAESRALGADCILLIAACLGDAELAQFSAWAAALSLDVLVEVHDREELERAHQLRTPLIGINNRDLRTFATSIDVTLALFRDVDSDRIVVSESGIHTPAQVARLRQHGVNAFLVGEAFMSAPDPGAKLRELFGQ